jgi:predicted Zn-dependent peptidase
MSRTHILARGALAAAMLSLPALAGAQQPAKAPAPLPVKAAAIPPFQETTLANGLRILLVESHREPVVSLVLMIPAGDSYDPVGQEGLASMAANVLTKGAGSRSAEQVASAIEGVGGSIGAESGADFFNVRANVLSENAPLAFELVGDAVTQPAFAAKEVELTRTQTLSSLQLEQSSPAALAGRFFAAELWGAHPYARRASPTSVRTLTIQNLRDLQHSRLVPKGALLVVAGDIKLATVRQLAQQRFGTWAGSPLAGTRRPAPPTRTRTEILLVHRPGSVQSNIIVGNLTFPTASSSIYPMTVANRVLGGGSDGRLFKILREKHGWTYGGYSNVTRNKDMGAVVATAEVRNPVTDSALTELLSLERGLGATPVPATELTAAKEGLVGSLPLQLETAQGLAEQVGRFAMLGLPKDYIRTLRPRLAAIDAAQLEDAARKYIRPDQALIVVVGDGAQIYEKLARVAPTRIVSTQGDPMQPSDLVQRTTSLPVDMTKLVERADSFAVTVQGNNIGFQTSALARTPSGYAYRTAMNLGGMMQMKQETTFGSDLKPQAVKGTGDARGTPLNTDLTYAGGRVKGTTVNPGPTGIENVKVDTTVAAGVLIDNMIFALVPTLNWTPNAKFTVSSYDAATNSVRPVTLSVGGTEDVTVPAGTFPAYRVLMSGQSQPLTLYITTAAPHRVVKMAPAGQPVEFVLVK